MSAAQSLLAALLRVSIEGAVVVALVALLVRAVPALPARLRCALWWAACLKLVAGLALLLTASGGFELALLPRAAAVLPGFAAQAGPGAISDSSTPGTAAVPPLTEPISSVGTSPLGEGRAQGRQEPQATPGPATRAALASPIGDPAARSWWLPVAAALAGLWLLGLTALAVATLATRGRLARRLRATAPLIDPEALALVAATAERLGVAVPPVRITGDAVPPQLTGALRPCLLLPRRALDAGRRRELALVVAHELAHLRRRDLLLGWVPALARGLFFFHPLAAHAAREYLLAREAACDAEVLRVLDATPRDYGRMLLTWSVALGTRRQHHGGPLAATLGHHRQLKRRLTMLETTSQHRGRLRPAIALLAAVPVLLAVAPVRLVAAPDADTAGGRATAAYAVSSAAAPHGTAATGDSRGEGVSSASASSRSMAPAAPALPAEPATAPRPPRQPAAAPYRVAAVAAPGSGGGSRSSHSWTWSDDGGEPLVYVTGDSSFGFYSSEVDADRVRALRHGSEPMLWFVRDGQEYVVRDPATLEKVDVLYAPMIELGKRQGELGGRQGKLGGEQGELGGEQGKLGAAQGKLGAQQGRLAADVAALAAKRVALEMDDDADPDALAELERRQDELEVKMRALGDQQRELGDQQRTLGEQQRALGGKQRALGEQQRALGEQQREASARARAEIDPLLDDAIASGKAEKVH